MRVSCPSCQTTYNIDDKRIPPGGAKLKCTKCQTTFPIKLGPAAAEGAVPLPGNGSSAAVPLPGLGTASVPLPGFGPPSSEESVPLPSARTRPLAQVSIPLPGIKAPHLAHAGTPAEQTDIVQLPGSGPPPSSEGGYDSVPLPGSSPGRGFSSIPLSSVPLPGISAAPPSPSGNLGASEPDPFSSFDANWETESTRVAMVPLPSAAYREPPPEAVPTAVHSIRPPPAAYPTSDAIPLPGTDTGELRMTEPAMPAVQLPGPSRMPAEEDIGFADADLIGEGTGSIPLPGFGRAPAPAAKPPPPSFDFSDLPSPADNPPPPPAEIPIDFSAPPPPAAEGFGFDFNDLPSPASSGAPPTVDLDFADLPTPATTPVQDLPIPAVSNLPSPAEPRPEEFSLDFAEPPPAPTAPYKAADPAGFGEVDFGEPPAAPRPPSKDELEFDPLSAAPSVPKDDLEADLSAPPPSSKAAGPADGLEMLSFIDDAAKTAKATSTSRPKATRFHIRRRSGKVFGPFDEGVVVKMLEDGQLLGNEDVSTDSENWSAIGSVAAFTSVIEKLMEGPTSSQSAAEHSGEAPQERGAPQASMDRLKQLYDGRMATVSMVDRRAETAKLRKRIPFFIGAGVLVLAIAAGASLGLTPYGVFGLKKLLPATVKQGTAEFADLQKGRTALLEDTFKSYSDALTLSEKVLRAKEYPEVRALWCQAVFYLDRRYAAAKPAQVNQAQAALEGIALLGEKNAEVVKAVAGSALARKLPEEALPRLEAAQARAPDDIELALVLAEAYATKRQNKQAADVLGRVLARHKDSSKALHALGDIRQADKNADEAAKLYEQALAADPNHVASAIELAAVELLVRKDLAKGKAALAKALDDKLRSQMGPAELARARALNGVVLAQEFHPKEAIAELQDALKLDKDSGFIKGNLARVLLSAANFADAVPLYQDATAKDPFNLEYMDGYLQALIGIGKMADAKSAVTAANNRFPGNARIAYLFGRVEDALDNTADAEGHYKRAINADPKLYEADLALAKMYLRLKRMAEAKPELEAAEQKAPNVPGVHSGAGRLALLEKNTDRAEAEFKKSIALDPTHAEGYLGLSEVALQRNDAANAKAQALKALELEPKVPGGRKQLGLALWRLGDLEGAIAELEKAKQEDSRSAAILLAIGAVRLDKADRGDKGELGAAEASISAALSLEPTNPEVHFYMARVKNRRLEHTQAIESMHNALDRAPDRPAFHYEMGVILHDAKKVPDAIEEWNTTLKLDPNYADALESLGHAYLDSGDFDKSIGYFEKVLKIDPKRTRVLAAIGDSFFQAGKWDKAIERYQQALKADASYAPAYYQIGRAYTEKGENTRAIDWYRRATTADPTNAQAFYYLGFAYKDRGAKGEAVKSFKAYLAKRPDAEDKKEIEDEIYDLTQE